MGLFFNRKKDKKSKKITISIENWEAGLLSKDYLFNEFASTFMYYCDRFYGYKEEFEDDIVDRKERVNHLSEVALNAPHRFMNLEKDSFEFTYNIAENMWKQRFSLRNVGMMQTITILQYLDVFVKKDESYTIDNILDYFYSSEELQKKQLDRPFAKIRTREEVDEYITLLQKIRADFEPFDENEDFYNKLGLLRDKNGNLLEPDWYSLLVPFSNDVIVFYKNLKF